MTNILAKSFEKEGPEDTSPSDDAVKEAAPIEESTEEAVQKISTQLPKRSTGSPALTETNRTGQRWPSTGSIRRDKSLLVPEVVDAIRRHDY